MNSSAEKLAQIRSALLQKSIDILVIPSSDPHIGENIPEYWRIIPWLTGFTGSAATVIITDSFAGLWTDSRYFIQAERELEGSGFEFINPGSYRYNNYLNFIQENARPGTKIGVDGRIFSIENFRKLKNRIDRKNITIDTTCDLISGLWTDRPSLPFSLAFNHPLKYAGRERSEKINEVRILLKKHNADYQFLTAPDDIMWLLNIRGGDLKYTPLLLSYALIDENQILLFIDEAKVPPVLASDFDRLGIVIFPYEETEMIVPCVTDGHSVLLNPKTTSVSLFQAISEKSEIIIEDISIPESLKCIKNNTEIANIGDVMVKEGVVFTKFFYWFFCNYGKKSMTEYSLSDKLDELRSEYEDYLCPSFPAIAAFNKNSALPHYLPENGQGSEIDGRGLLLIDSGGQYLGGTTDLTRTVAVGIPTDQQKRDFTFILKGHINIALAKFPRGTSGFQLDFLARKAMWKNGINYSHGTGHGVGYCLNVHEGPQSISPVPNKTSLEAGMLTSNEPAIYREGEYGIRTENLILCYEDEETEFGRFLKFDTVSFCYLDKSLIDRSLLDQEEIAWLNSYHAEVHTKISPHLTTEEKAWLKEMTDPL